MYNRNNLAFNKQYTRLKPINRNNAIDGYIRIICKYSKKIPTEIIMCIIDYWNINDSYFEILCNQTKTYNYKIEEKDSNNSTKIELKSFGNKAVSMKCINCLEKDCLEFKQSYNMDLHPNKSKFCHTYVEAMDINNTMNRFKNIGNEYQCKKCKYYTVFNVKMKVISYRCFVLDDTKQLDSWYHFVTPLKPNNKETYTNVYNDIDKDPKRKEIGFHVENVMGSL